MAVQLAVTAVQLHLHLQYNRSCTAVQLAHCYISIAVQLAISIGNHIRIVLALLGRNGSTIGSTIGSIPSGSYFAPRHRRNGPQDRRNCEEKVRIRSWLLCGSCSRHLRVAYDAESLRDMLAN